MPGSRCTVATCSNSLSKTKKAGRNVSYHRFPRDPGMRKTWVVKCKRDGKWNPDSCHVCSDHFLPSDYERDLSAELLGNTAKRKLRENSIPTLNLPCTTDPSASVLGRTIRMQDKCRKKEHEDIIEAAMKEPSPSPTEAASFTEADALDYKVMYEECLLQNLILQQELKELKRTVVSLRNELRTIKSEKHGQRVVNEKVQSVLSKVFTPNQINLILKKRDIVRWTNKEMSLAFTLRYFSKRAYLFLRQKLHYPLPGISSFQRWASRIEMRNGVLSDVLNVMTTAAKDLGPKDRLAILQFDEMKVLSKYEYDPLHDEVVGRHNQMQVMMARGLCAPWKQPIYVDFDKKVTKDLLMTIVSHLYCAGYIVVACVSDCGSGNQGLWKELGLCFQNNVLVRNSFPHPNTGGNIYYIPDAPHLLKLTRNWLLDTGFDIGDIKIRKEPLIELIESTKTELSVCHKLSSLHIICSGVQRQNVRLAAELLSHTTAAALKRYQAGEKVAQDTSEFIDLINRWFDLMNSYIPFNNVPFKAAYGKHLCEQNLLLDKVFEVILKMRCPGKNTLQVFQKGILMSITSIKLLLIEVKKYGVDYLLTAKCNQDSLENLFSQIRTRGGMNDHPSPLLALHRLRLIVLGKNAGAVQRGTNTKEGCDEEYILAQALTKTNVNSGDRVDCEGSVSLERLVCDSEPTDDSPQSLSLESDLPEVTTDALCYLAGWVARKFMGRHSHLGSYTHEIKNKIKCESSLVPWVVHLSHGGLVQPSPDFIQELTKLENKFLQITGGTLPPGKKIVSTITDVLCCNSNLDKAIVKCYVKQRVFIRLKYLNKKNVTRKSNLGNVSKKLKKIVQ